MKPLLTTVLPDFSRELQALLHRAPELAASVDQLRIVDRCRCGDDFCATFYTEPPPEGAFGPRHRTISFEVTDAVILDVVEGRIVCVEVLDRPNVRSRLLKVCP